MPLGFQFLMRLRIWLDGCLSKNTSFFRSWLTWEVIKRVNSLCAFCECDRCIYIYATLVTFVTFTPWNLIWAEKSQKYKTVTAFSATAIYIVNAIYKLFIRLLRRRCLLPWRYLGGAFHLGGTLEVPSTPLIRKQSIAGPESRIESHPNS